MLPAIAQKYAEHRTPWRQEEEREIWQLQFLGWPEDGSPEDPAYLLNLLHHVNLKHRAFGESDTGS